MKRLIILTGFCLAAIFSHAQIQDASAKKIDIAAQKIIRYLQHKQPDSIYAMAGISFRNKITQENFHAITMDQILPVNDFSNVAFVSYAKGINKYRVEGVPALQLMIGLDLQDKVETLLIQPYTD